MALPFVIPGIATVGGIPQDGLMVAAYDVSRFSSAPVFGTPLPGGAADAGPVLTSASVYGGTGHYLLTVPSADQYHIAAWDPNNPTVVAWEQFRIPSPHTSQAGWTQVINRTSSWSMAPRTTCTYGTSLTQSTIPVSSTAGGSFGGVIVPAFTAPGVALFQTSGITYAAVAFSGLTPTSLTGCELLSGAATGVSDVCQATYQAGSGRRLVTINARILAGQSSSVGMLELVAQVGGEILQTKLGAFYIGDTSLTGGETDPGIAFSATTPVDPEGYFALEASLGGDAQLSILSWLEIDF
jgi:hypothetical protein